VRSCKPIAGGEINVTAQHTLVSAYSGKDKALSDAIVDVTAGGWRNAVSASSVSSHVCWFCRLIARPKEYGHVQMRARNWI
jgi:hypothetical protein